MALSLLLAPAIGAQGPARRVPRDSVSADSLRADSAAMLLPQRPPGELSDMGILHAGSVRFCYEREGLGRDPALQANLDVTVTIAPDGVVKAVTVDTSRVSGQGARDVVSCVAQAVAQWRYQAGAYAVESTTYTFNLAPAGKP